MTITVLETIYEARLNARGDVLRLDHTESNGRQMVDLRFFLGCGLYVDARKRGVR